MVVQVRSSGRRPSRNASCVTLTKVYHMFMVGSLSHVASRNHTFRCYDLIPDGPPALPMWRHHTDTTISFSIGGSSSIAGG